MGTDDLDAVSRPVAHLHASCSLHRSSQLFLLLRLQLLWLPMAPRKSLDSFKVKEDPPREPMQGWEIWEGPWKTWASDF